MADRVSHFTILNEKKKLLLENLAKALPLYFSEPSATLSIKFLHCICLSSLSYMQVRASSILEDFNWAATLVLRMHRIVGVASNHFNIAE